MSVNLVQYFNIAESRVCVACDTDGLTISGLVMARYLSLATRCSHEDAIKAVKISHESFFPLPYAKADFVNADLEVISLH